MASQEETLNWLIDQGSGTKAFLLIVQRLIFTHFIIQFGMVRHYGTLIMFMDSKDNLN